MASFYEGGDRRKTRADYAIGATAAPITAAEADAAIGTTTRFIDTTVQLLSPSLAPGSPTAPS